MPLQKSTCGLVQQLFLVYWVSQLEVRADRQSVQKQKEMEKLVDWDYAGLHLINSIPLQDKLNYHKLCFMRRERQQYDPKRNISQSQERYEVNQFRQLYNAVFSTKPPHLRNSEENYIQFLKDDFFRKQMVPSNPKTSREKYEWFVKKTQGSFFGGKYDFETYLAGNFTARRRRSVDNEGPINKDKEPKIESKVGLITSNEVKQMKFEDNVANIINGIQDSVYKHPEEVDNKLELKYHIHPSNEKEHAANYLHYKEIIDNIEINVKDHQKDNVLKNVHETNLKNVQKKDRFDYDIKNDELYTLGIGNDPIALIKKRKSAQSKSNIRARRIRRELMNILHNPGNKPLNRSWQLDPRNPWNKNLRYYKHVRLFNDFYVDFYTREGSDRLPSNETFVKIRPPPGFRANKKNKWSRAWDSQPVSYYVHEMEKMAAQFPPDSGGSYGVTSKEQRRRERDRNMTAKIEEEELNWKKQLSQLKNKLRKKNITQMEHDKILDDIERDKKLKYKLYKTRTTQHVIRKAMDQLEWAAEFVESAIIRDKRDVRDMGSGLDAAMCDEFANDVVTSERKAKMVKIRSKRVKRDISEEERKLENKMENVRHIQKLQEAASCGDGEVLARNKRGEYDSYHPPTGEPRYRKSFDYDPIARHNAVYYEESVEKTRPTEAKPKKTTVLTPEEIKRREELLKTFDKDMQSAYRFSDRHNEEFMALKKSLNKTRRKRRALTNVDNCAIKYESNNAILDVLKKLLDLTHHSLDSPISHIRGKRRKKRYTIEELLKGPVPDKFEEKKTKLEADAAENAHKPGVKEFVAEGTENVKKHIHNVVEGNVQDLKVEKNFHADDSKLHPDHPDNNRVDIYAWDEDRQRNYVKRLMDVNDYSLGIRERMHQDFLKARKELDVGMIDRGKLNRMELERAHKEREEFLKRQPLPTTTDQLKKTDDLEALSSFQSEPRKKGEKKKDKLREQMRELKDLKAGIL